MRNESPEDKEEVLKRLRSIPRKHHSSLKKDHFGQHPAKNSGVVRGLQMGPTMGLQILMTLQGKSLSKAYNFTRNMVVSFVLSAIYTLNLSKRSYCHFSAFQDCCHSVALE